MQKTALSGCDPDGTPCPTGTYCHRFNPEFERPPFIDDSFEGMCWPWAREGALCIEAGSPANVQCEPGTYCRPSSPEGSPVWTCVRSCESEEDCPCAHDGFEPECVGEGGSAPICTTCAGVGVACSQQEGAPKCCGEAQCDELADGVAGNEQGLCCLPEGNECEMDSDCCGANVCFEGSCEPCGSVGDPPTDAGCCPGLDERDDVCSRECRWQGERVYGGEFCTPTGAQESCVGRIVCNPSGAECRPNSVSFDNDCDGVDDDCDGTADEHFEGGQCYDTPPGCQSGFRPSAAGRETCDYPDEECVYGTPLNPSYCSLDSSGNIRGPGDCAVGHLMGPPGCSSDSDCSPGEACGTTASVCGPGVDGCCDGPYTASGPTWFPCCRIDLSQTGTCWNPGDRR